MFKSKAQTLERIAECDTKFVVPEFAVCSRDHWGGGAASLASGLATRFAGKQLAIRSSAMAEDSNKSSMAGAFLSELNVPAEGEAIAQAVDRVFESYGDYSDSEDEVIVQKMVENVAISGVAMTHSLDDGAPYYTISYDDVSGRTDTITSGAHPHKTVFIHRSCPDMTVRSERLRAVLRLVRDVESLLGDKPMDIEFAVGEDNVSYLLQVRPIAAKAGWDRDVGRTVDRALDAADRQLFDLQSKHPVLLGETTILANMPDWNPAEMISVVPRLLAASMYRRLITKSVWASARERMGYRSVSGVELMYLVSGHGYIDVRASLTSFLPEGLDEPLSSALVDSGLRRLRAEPAFHDKLEFELSQTVRTPTFDEDFKRIHPKLTDNDKNAFDAALTALTVKIVDLGPNGSLTWAENMVAQLEARQKTRSLDVDRELSAHQLLCKVAALLSECIEFGTLPFAVLARHGFVAQSLLNSCAQTGAVGEDRLDYLKSSIETIATELTSSMEDVISGLAPLGAFMSKFGHLRPGTYDIRSPRYCDRPELFSDGGTGSRSARDNKSLFEFSQTEREKVGAILSNSGLDGFSADDMYSYVVRATKGREWAKLVFTRNLSDVLELLARWGELRGLDREEMSFLTIDAVLDEHFSPDSDIGSQALGQIMHRNRERWQAHSSVRLPHILMERDNLFIVPLQRSDPNFITRKNITAGIVELSEQISADIDLAGKIVCIQSADPGFDWIFTQNIAGLLTMHGGPNSHMAIRCAEFSIPAAIGIGEELYVRIVKAKSANINCADRIIEIDRK